jgi:hypothetical protein
MPATRYLKVALRLYITAILLTIVMNPLTSFALSEQQRKAIDSGVRYFNIKASACNGIGIVNGSIDRFLQVLAFQESGGDPTIQNSKSSASGKYQYIDDTWQSRVAVYGPSGQYPRAYLAPETIQDAVAYIEYTQKFASLNNDLFKLAVSHYNPSALTDESKLDQVPSGGNSITPRQYADRLIQNIGSGLGSNIPLSYSEAPEFQLWLSRVGGAPADVNTGVSVGGCTSSSAVAAIVRIAQQELAGGANERDGSYFKYTGGVTAPWCGYFASWVFEQAGKPFEGGALPAVSGMLDYAIQHSYFHPRGEAGFTPQPGDIAIYKEGLAPYPSHVNIVISYDASTNKYTSIGGNEGDSIKQNTWSTDLSALTGFMRVP